MIVWGVCHVWSVCDVGVWCGHVTRSRELCSQPRQRLFEGRECGVVCFSLFGGSVSFIWIQRSQSPGYHQN